MQTTREADLIFRGYSPPLGTKYSAKGERVCHHRPMNLNISSVTQRADPECVPLELGIPGTRRDRYVPIITAGIGITEEFWFLVRARLR